MISTKAIDRHVWLSKHGVCRRLYSTLERIFIIFSRLVFLESCNMVSFMSLRYALPLEICVRGIKVRCVAILGQPC